MVYAIIVDAYSTGKYLAPAFKTKGFSCIHIKSSPDLPARFTHVKEDFVECLEYTGSEAELFSQLSDKEVLICVPGSESGVELADWLSEKLHLPTNGRDSSALRRNKYEMTLAVKEYGLKTVEHFLSENVAEIIKWAEHISDKPIVLKPIDSANGDGVYFCNDESDIEIAFQKIISAENYFGKKNSVVLAESYNAGVEYIINTMSWEGKHFVAEMWKIIRKPHSTIYDYAEIIRPQDKEWQPIVDYTCHVLDALKIQYGAGTTELKYSKENGPVLLETSARLMGGANIEFSRKIAKFSQVDLLVQGYSEPSEFLKNFNFPRPPLPYYGMDVLLISDSEGLLKTDINAEISSLGLTSLHSSKLYVNQGEKIPKTTHQGSTPGEIFLFSTDKELLEIDYKNIREWEKTFYKNHTEYPSFKNNTSADSLVV